MSARIVLHRGGGFCDRWRAYKVVIDGEVRGKLKRNSTLDFEVDPGPHEVAAQIDWCSGNVVRVTVAEAGLVEIDIANPHRPWHLSKIMTSAPDTYLMLSLRSAGS